MCFDAGPVLGGAWSNSALCKTCSLLCVREHPRIDNSSAPINVFYMYDPVNQIGSVKVRVVGFWLAPRSNQTRL